MQAPQSDADLQPVIQALRRLDHRLDVRWNPRAKIVERGRIDAYGKVSQPRHDGRWEVGIVEGDNRWLVIYQIRSDDGSEAYKPVGLWLVEFMQKWDSHQAHFRSVVDQAWKEHDDVDTRAETIDDAAVRETVEVGHFAAYAEGGRATWKGQGADFTSMAKAAMSPPNGLSALIKSP